MRSRKCFQPPLDTDRWNIWLWSADGDFDDLWLQYQCISLVKTQDWIAVFSPALQLAAWPRTARSVSNERDWSCSIAVYYHVWFPEISFFCMTEGIGWIKLLHYIGSNGFTDKKYTACLHMISTCSKTQNSMFLVEQETLRELRNAMSNLLRMTWGWVKTYEITAFGNNHWPTIKQLLPYVWSLCKIGKSYLHNETWWNLYFMMFTLQRNYLVCI